MVSSRRVVAQVFFKKKPSTVSESVWNRQLVVPWNRDWETENRIQIEHFLCWSCEKSQRSSGSAKWSRDRQAQYLYARCLRGLVKLPSKKFQNLRCLRAWPHSVIHGIRCEPARRWLANGLTVVGVPPKRCSKNLTRDEFGVLSS